MACEDANLKLVKFVTVPDVDDEKCFDDSFMQFWKLKFGHNVSSPSEHRPQTPTPPRNDPGNSSGIYISVEDSAHK